MCGWLVWLVLQRRRAFYREGIIDDSQQHFIKPRCCHRWVRAIHTLSGSSSETEAPHFPSALPAKSVNRLYWPWLPVSVSSRPAQSNNNRNVLSCISCTLRLLSFCTSGTSWRRWLAQKWRKKLVTFTTWSYFLDFKFPLEIKPFSEWWRTWRHACYPSHAAHSVFSSIIHGRMSSEQVSFCGRVSVNQVLFSDNCAACPISKVSCYYLMLYIGIDLVVRVFCLPKSLVMLVSLKWRLKPLHSMMSLSSNTISFFASLTLILPSRS